MPPGSKHRTLKYPATAAAAPLKQTTNMQLNNLETFVETTRRRVAVGTVITLADPAVSELAADAGFDFTWIDAEHSPFTIQELHHHVMAVRGTPCAPFIRVPWNEHGILKPVLDLAPAGVIVPMVNSAELAREAVAACRYPPTGTRGCGTRRATGYGAKPFAEYLEASGREPLVIVQIEHIDAVRNLDAILQVPGVGSICIGPFDLSGSMGKLGQVTDPEVVRVIEEICAKTRRAGVMLGAFGAPFAPWRKRGVNWTAVCSDCSCLFSHARQLLDDARREQGA